MKKPLKIIFVIIAIIIFIIILPIFVLYKNQTVAVLGYHNFTNESSLNEMQINIDKFKKQMSYLKKHRYHTLTLEEMECFLNKTCKIPKKSVLITMDDGYLSNYDLAFPILKEYDFNAVVFYMGVNSKESNNTYMNLDTIKKARIEYPQIEFASHTYDLHHPEDYQLDFETIDKDFIKQDKILHTFYFAYPYGHVSDNFIKALEKNNYKLAFTFGPDKEHRKAKQTDDKYHIPRLNISASIPLWKFKLRLIIPF